MTLYIDPVFIIYHGETWGNTFHRRVNVMNASEDLHAKLTYLCLMDTSTASVWTE